MSGDDYSTRPPFSRHLSGPQDLVTAHAATRAGFITMVLEKNRISSPYVTEARSLKSLALEAQSPYDLLDMRDIQAGLLTASGASDKADRYLTPEDRRQVIAEFIRNYLEPAGDDFADELTYRFLLIRGDALGGKMRNLAGTLAQRRITEFILAGLKLEGSPYFWFSPVTKKWVSGEQLRLNDASPSQIAEEILPYDDSGSGEKVNGIGWESAAGHRVLLFNIKVPFVRLESESKTAGKNVDLCLMNCRPSDLGSKSRRQVIANPAFYVALGELKGGIDPAGADEHWKTARAHLLRIRSAFADLPAPSLFYVGAAVQAGMAQEIWQQLTAGQLSNAANLTVDFQITSLVNWLRKL